MRDKISNIFFFVILGISTLLFLYVLSPFAFPFFWAAVIAGVFRPIYKRLNQRKNLPNTNACITIALILVILILPLTIIGMLLFQESVHLYNSVSEKGFTEEIQNTLSVVQNNRLLHHFHIDNQEIVTRLSEMATGFTKFMFDSLKKLTQNTIIFILMFAVMLYTLFYLIRDGHKIVNTCIAVCPLGKERTLLLLDQFMSTTKAALKSTLILGGLQGIAGGILFWLTGIQGALMWGSIMIVAAILPTGSAIIWAPAGIIMLLLGQIWQGITILIAGTFIVGLIDNLLRPILVGRDVMLHPLLIFLTTLGGLAVFGFSGFIIGPVIASLALSLWDFFQQYQNDPDSLHH